MKRPLFLRYLFTSFLLALCVPVMAAQDKTYTSASSASDAGHNMPSIRDQIMRPPLTLAEYSEALTELRAGLPRGVRDDVGRIIVLGLVELSGQGDFLNCLGGAQGGYQSVTSQLEENFLAPPENNRPNGGLGSLTSQRESLNDVYSATETAEALSYVELASRVCGGGFGSEGENQDLFNLDPAARPDSGGSTSPEDVANYTQCLEVRATWAQDQCSSPVSDGGGSGSGGLTAREQGGDLIRNIALWTLTKVIDAGISAALPDINPHDKETEFQKWNRWEEEHAEERVNFDSGLGEIAAAIASAIIDWLFGADDQEECANGYQFAATHPLAGANYQIGGAALGPSEMLQGCVCSLSVTHLGESNPDTPWDCKSPSEQRRDCARNPYTPDDAPRPECIDFLYDDAGASPPANCVNALCPTDYDIEDPTRCTCQFSPGNSSTAPQVIPTDPNACAAILCPDDSNAVPTAGGCLCQTQTLLPDRVDRNRPTLDRLPRQPRRDPSER